MKKKIPISPYEKVRNVGITSHGSIFLWGYAVFAYRLKAFFSSSSIPQAQTSP
jgi:hypothetical protein